MAIHDLLIVPEVPEEIEMIEGVEGLAWEHATLFASLSDVEIGSEEFAILHKDLMKRYRECGDHLCFIQHTAMRMLQALLLTNRVALVVHKDDTTEDVSSSITYLTELAASCIMWTYASYPFQWIPNAHWEYLDEDARGVDFSVSLPDLGETKDDDNR